MKRKEGKERGEGRVNFPLSHFRGKWGATCQRQQIPDQAVFILESPWNDGFLPFQLIEDGSRIKEGRGAIDEFFTLWLTVFQSVQRNCISSIRVRIDVCFVSFHSIFHLCSFRYYVETVLSIPRFIFFFLFSLFPYPTSSSQTFISLQPLMTSSIFFLFASWMLKHRSQCPAMGSRNRVHSAKFVLFSWFVIQDLRIYVR